METSTHTRLQLLSSVCLLSYTSAQGKFIVNVGNLIEVCNSRFFLFIAVALKECTSKCTNMGDWQSFIRSLRTDNNLKVLFIEGSLKIIKADIMFGYIACY